MTYELTKGGGGYDLDKSLRKCYIGLGWDMDGNNFDLDVVALMINNRGKLIPSPNGVVFYNNPTYPSCNWKDGYGNRNESIIQKQPVWLSPDNRTGEGDGDDEFIHINLTSLPIEVSDIMIAVSIYGSAGSNQNFGKIKNAFVRIAETETSSDLAIYRINQKFTNETCLVAATLHRSSSGWEFKAIGKANNFDLGQLINSFS